MIIILLIFGKSLSVNTVNFTNPDSRLLLRILKPKTPILYFTSLEWIIEKSFLETKKIGKNKKPPRKISNKVLGPALTRDYPWCTFYDNTNSFKIIIIIVDPTPTQVEEQIFVLNSQNLFFCVSL